MGKAMSWIEKDLLSQEFQALMLLEENPNNKWILKNKKDWRK